MKPSLVIIASPDGSIAYRHNGREVSVEEARQALLSDPYAASCWASMLHDAAELVEQSPVETPLEVAA